MRLREVLGIACIAAVATLSAQSHAQQPMQQQMQQQGGPDAGQCEQVRAAVAEHGLQAARKHAMENYGLTLADLHRVEQDCRIDGRGRSTKK